MKSEKSGFVNKISEIWRKMQVKYITRNVSDVNDRFLLKFSILCSVVSTTDDSWHVQMPSLQ